MILPSGTCIDLVGTDRSDAGATWKEIADELGLNPRTVKNLAVRPAGLVIYPRVASGDRDRQAGCAGAVPARWAARRRHAWLASRTSGRRELAHGRRAPAAQPCIVGPSGARHEHLHGEAVVLGERGGLGGAAGRRAGSDVPTPAPGREGLPDPMQSSR